GSSETEAVTDVPAEAETLAETDVPNSLADTEVFEGSDADTEEREPVVVPLPDVHPLTVPSIKTAARTDDIFISALLFNAFPPGKIRRHQGF
nr:hypothetical protein [Lachnospiraceae bacterium]